MDCANSQLLLSKPVIIPGERTADDSIPLIYRRKIKFPPSFEEVYGHHRGGWKYVMGELLQQLTVGDGILCFSDVGDVVADDRTRDLALKEPWIGFAHQTPKTNYPEFPDLERMVQDPTFQEALKNCRGLYALSSVVKNYLVKHLPGISVCLVFYPCAPFKRQHLFDMTRFKENKEKKVVFIGKFMRNFQAAYDLDTPSHLKKILIKPTDVNFDELYDVNCQQYKLRTNSSVEVWMEQVTDEEYDNLLSQNIVFINMFDASACTTVNECAARGTPLIINRLPAIEEYLGKNYPLFYDTLEEAGDILGNDDLLEVGSQYLHGNKELKRKLSGETFLQSFANSAIYRDLELPRSQTSPSQNPPQTKFPRFDLSIVVHIHSETNGLSGHLERIKSCFSDACVQVILWCARKVHKDVKEWCEPFRDDLHIDTIESSEDYTPDAVYHAVKELMFSKTLLAVNGDSIFDREQLQRFTEESKSRGRKEIFLLDVNVIRKLQRPSQDKMSKEFDVSLVMCQYKRVGEMVSILKGLCKQKYDGRFQLIIWNNNEEEQETVEVLSRCFIQPLNITLIQSSCNYYCAIRFAVKELMKSDLMLIIDDDIQPSPGYVQRFVDKYHQYGPRATICCRGHIFPEHSVNEENPHIEWELEQKQKSNLFQFRDQSKPDCRVHFIHADNLLISKELLDEALQYELPRQEFIIVDDYWLSFVLSHHMGISLWRVKADDVMYMTESGDNPDIALYHQLLTRDHRIDFYVYHLRQGWPNSRPLPY